MSYPIVSVMTQDELKLHGLFLEPITKSSTIYIHIHGTSGNFYWSDFLGPLSQRLLSQNIAFLSTNNHGSYTYEIERGTVSYGASLEKFADCLSDIDIWTDFALSKGYTNVILSGHSFGTEKVIYYLNKGKNKGNIVAIVLLGFADSFGNQQKYEQRIGQNYISQSQELVQQGKGHLLLEDLCGLAGDVPITAQTYLDFYADNSELSKTFPLRNGKDLTMYRNIDVPILAVISDHEAGEYTIIPITQAVELLQQENPQTEAHIITNTNHSFYGKEDQLVNLINQFIKRKILCNES
jgi:pimeloyl-ACP methyl ester carboxylesterase